MTVLFGFYNSLNDDRHYDSVDISRLFDGLISDGVFATYGGGLLVSENSGMQVVVSTGRAWFEHTWTFNDSPLFLTVDTSELLMSRIDTLILEVNTTDAVRANTIRIVKGAPGSTPVAPTLIRANGLYQYPLADIFVAPTVTTILQANITNRIGTTVTPFVTGIIDTIATEDLITQWHSEFDIWFDAMKDQLSTDAAGNLQTQINTLNNTLNNLQVVPVGAIISVPSKVATPSGWLATDGSLKSRATYPNLFTAIGGTYDPGNGSTTFGLPDNTTPVDNLFDDTVYPLTNYACAMVRLSDGRVLVTGGIASGSHTNACYIGTLVNDRMSWVQASNLPITLAYHTMTLLPDGRVLIAGGHTNASTIVTNTYFGTISGNTITWAAGTALLAAISSAAAALLSDGRVLISGGYNGSSSRYEMTFGTISGNTITWAAGTQIPARRYGHTMHIHSDGRVFIIGGNDGSALNASVYVGVISGTTITWSLTTPFPRATIYQAGVTLPDGRLCLTGGNGVSVASQTTHIGTVEKNYIHWTTEVPKLPRETKAMTGEVLSDGTVLLLGEFATGSIVYPNTYRLSVRKGLIKT
jgi:microcystin-dependent protein